MRGRSALWLLIVLTAVGCRVNFEDRSTPGLEGYGGLMVSEPGALVPEEYGYALSAALDGNGYAIAWASYASGSDVLELRFAVASEAGQFRLDPTLVENVSGSLALMALYALDDRYMLVYLDNSGTLVMIAIDSEGNTLARNEETGINLHAWAATPIPGGLATTTTYYDELSVRLYNDDGTPSGAVIPIDAGVSKSTSTPWLIPDGGGFQLVWTDRRTGTPAMWHAALDATGQPTGTSAPLFDTGSPQATVHVATTLDGFFATWDEDTSFPVYAMRFTTAGAPVWPEPLVLYDERFHHDTIEVAASEDGRLGAAWITTSDTLLENVEFDVVSDAQAPVQPHLLTDPTYRFCYPVIARARSSFGAAFSGSVEGSFGVFLAIEHD